MSPLGELGLQRLELSRRQLVADAPRAAVRQERHAAIDQAEHSAACRARSSCPTCTTSHSPKWLPPPYEPSCVTLAANLGIVRQQLFQAAVASAAGGFIVAQGERNLRSASPIRAGCRAASQTLARSTFNQDALAERLVHMTRFRRISLPAASAGWGALADGVDQGAARAVDQPPRLPADWFAADSSNT